MSFNTTTIQMALHRIDQGDYALPALQREFVWHPWQICRLFDSLMQDYPIGSFLFWLLPSEMAASFQFYDFMREYHQLTNAYCQTYSKTTRRPGTAVLDGQQRLTAFNIALHGSYAEKKKWFRHDNPDAYPVKRLYLNIKQKKEGDEGMPEYDFQFLAEKEASVEDETRQWFRVGKILEFENQNQAIFSVEDITNRFAMETLGKLWQVICEKHIINYYEEPSTSLDKVLNIFIRINNGGTQLSYADLLLSLATTQWKQDARKLINDLVQQMNVLGKGDAFRFNKDFILKSGLMLTDQTSIKFQAKNFTQKSMELVESQWSEISDALYCTAKLMHHFGFGGRHIRSLSPLLPVAYYIYKRGYNTASFVESNIYKEEREQIRQWIIRISLSGVLSASGLTDHVMPKMRDVINEMDTFDYTKLMDCIRSMGRDPTITAQAIEDLLGLDYNNRKTLLVLSLVYDFVDTDTTTFQVDHIFPRALCHKKKLRVAGLDKETIEYIKRHHNSLPNLWLLQGTQNREKQSKLPATWLKTQFPDDTHRQHIKHSYHLDDMVEHIGDFKTFFEGRKARMRTALFKLFNTTPMPSQTQDIEPSPEPEQTTPQPTQTPTPTQWNEDFLALLDSAHHPLAHALMQANVGEPRDVGEEITHNGMTTQHRSIMNWRRGGKHLYLVEETTPVHESEKLIYVTLHSDYSTLAEQLKAALSSL